MTGGIRKPSESEEEYIARIEYQRRKRVEEEKHREMAELEKRHRKELHFMHCPKCGMKLIEVDYKSLKVDRCSACNGIWLDAGELEAAVELERGLLGRIFGL
ncbi:zf-TFIIB domain-containing protein [Candidatus Deferrimicrobium sp.]|uniref:TFIIB-type zinc ribbon-containing protein n=1 Tax=Candidatus Deferrimicrobium sp. TaxID=3060586 RepID=UPI002ED405BB